MKKVFFVMCALLFFCVGPVQAQPPEGRAVQYMVKFVCGWLAPAPPAQDRHLKPGNYATAINIYNHNGSGVVRGSKRVALFYAMGATPPPVIGNLGLSVFNRRVLEVDCTDIWTMAGVPPGTFLKGMVHIGLDERLEVAAVYTNQTHNDPMAGPDPGAGISIDVEYVRPLIEVPSP